MRLVTKKICGNLQWYVWLNGALVPLEQLGESFQVRILAFARPSETQGALRPRV